MVTTFYPPESFGGDGRVVERLSRALVRRGHRVTVVCCGDAYRFCGGSEPAPEEKGSDGPRVIRLRSPLGPLSPIVTQATGRPGLKRARLEEILSEGFDVIHFHNVSLVGGPGVLGMGRARLRLYTLHEHWLVCPMHVFWKDGNRLCDRKTCFSCQLRSGRPPQLWRYGTLLDRGLANVDLLLAPSRFTLEKHRAEGVKRPIELLPHFVPDAPVRSAPPVRPIFLYAGRFELSKGVDAVLSAADAVGGAEFRLAGDGPLRRELHERSKGRRNVRLLGNLPPDRIGEEMANATAIIVPSRCLETFGLSAAEAMMRGVPVVARRRGALTELVEESGGGLLFDEDREIAPLLRRLAEDPELVRELGSRGREAALVRWGEQEHLRLYLSKSEARLQ
jgi:glycosyltransferase involved in cell wall biosynthesis